MVGKLEMLRNLGFEEVGMWTLNGETLEYSLTRYTKEKKLLYAFVANQEVKYIGKSNRTLTARMNGYRKPGVSQRTNISNNKHIIASLRSGVPVQILVFVPKAQINYYDIPINIAAGLEDILIERTNPPWNRLGATAATEDNVRSKIGTCAEQVAPADACERGENSSCFQEYLA